MRTMPKILITDCLDMSVLLTCNKHIYSTKTVSQVSIVYLQKRLHLHSHFDQLPIRSELPLVLDIYLLKMQDRLFVFGSLGCGQLAISELLAPC